MIISISNQKGGVAKTTSTHNLGVALSEAGKKVLMIDFDSQASLTISVKLEPLEIKNNIVSALQKNKKPIQDCITVLNENLHISTSLIDLAHIEVDMLTRASREGILKRALTPIQNEYDYILIDCPPQLSVLTVNALSCADYVIIPVKTDYLSYRGLTQLIETVNEINELINPDLKIMGVIATLYESRAKDDNDILDRLKKEYEIMGVIKRMSATKKGIYDGQAVVEYEPTSDVAVEYRNIANKILNI